MDPDPPCHQGGSGSMFSLTRLEPMALRFDLHGLREHQLSEYEPTWEYQRQVHDKVAAGEVEPTVIFVEHPPVYTAGKRTKPEMRPFDGTPVVDVDRGGLITYHGPGQLVGYPIIPLPELVGAVDYVRRVEEAIIRWLGSIGVRAGRVPDRTGVWLPEVPGVADKQRKICAIGVRIAKRTTYHGFALNIASNLDYFHNIIPCGISPEDADVTSLAHEIELGTCSLPQTPSLVEVADGLAPFLAEMFTFQPYTPSPDLSRRHPRSVATP